MRGRGEPVGTVSGAPPGLRFRGASRAFGGSVPGDADGGWAPDWGVRAARGQRDSALVSPANRPRGRRGPSRGPPARPLPGGRLPGPAQPAALPSAGLGRADGPGLLAPRFPSGSLGLELRRGPHHRAHGPLHRGERGPSRLRAPNPAPGRVCAPGAPRAEAPPSQGHLGPALTCSPLAPSLGPAVGFRWGGGGLRGCGEPSAGRRRLRPLGWGHTDS